MSTNQNSTVLHSETRPQRRVNPRPDADNEQFLTRLSAAIRSNELLVHYQPRYNCLTGHADYYEAMVRWERPELGVFYPQMFLKAAESHGLIFAIDLWVFEQACADLKRMHRKLSRRVKLAINVSSLDCESVYYSQKLIDLCTAHKLPLSSFEFEISEGSSVRDMRKVVAFCKTLGEHGATFCLDNFGTGHASLERLHELPVTSIKFDPAFIRKIGTSKRNDIILKNLHRLADELDIQTIAGGVETQQQFDFLNQLHCNHMQGFYFATPAASNKLDKSSLFMKEGSANR